MKTLADCRLYGILDLGYVDRVSATDVTRRMLEGGVGVVQLRAKHHTKDEIERVASDVLPLCRASGVPLILNDHADLVARIGADGVHVGQDDLPVAEARAIAGPGSLVGLSTHSLAQATAAREQCPDYIGFGPLFATPTKPDYPPVGLGDIRGVHALVGFPVFCIGGIKRENLAEVIAAGAHRVVIVSGILRADDIAAYCRSCLALLG